MSSISISGAPPKNRYKFMVFKRFLNLNYWLELAIEAYWKNGFRTLQQPVTTYPLNPERLSQVTVHWPAKYEWKHTARWLDPLIDGFRRYVRVKKKEIPQVPKIILTEFLYRGRIYPIVIDQSDYLDSINEEWAARSLLYFKMQYASEGYSVNTILPGGFVPHDGSLYHYLPYLREIREKKEKKSYRYDVYSRFSFEFAKDTRKKIDTIISCQDFKRGGGPSLVRYSQFLREVAQSKICIDVPGNADVCCRLVDYLAVGACIIGLKPRTVFQEPLIDRKHIVFAKPDLSDLVSLCKYYLEHQLERDQIAQNARDFFDKYLHRDQIAAYYLHHFLKTVA